MHVGLKKNTISQSRKPTIIRFINKPLDTELVMYTTGLPDFGYQEATYYTSKKYGFKYWPADGCIVSDSILYWVHERNEATNKKLTKLHRQKWEIQFYKQVQLVQSRISQAKKILNSNFLRRSLQFHDQYIYTDIDFFPNETDTNLVHAILSSNLSWRKYTLTQYWIWADIDIKKQTLRQIKTIDSSEFIISNLRN